MCFRTKTGIGAGVVFLMSVLTSWVHAQSLDEIMQCRALNVRDERLRCFDEATTPVASDEDVVAAAASQAQRPKASLAGNDDEFGAQDLVRARERDGEEGDNTLRATLVALRFTNSGRYIIELDNGQIWRQIRGDSGSLNLSGSARGGVPIIIKKALLGSHRLRTASSKKTIRVERIR